MAPRDNEIDTLVVPTSESDMVRTQGTGRKYAGAIALFALVAVIVGGVGMGRHSMKSNVQDTEMGDIIEACADYTVQASCSAASCNWNMVTVQCEEVTFSKKEATTNEGYAVADEVEASTNATATPAPANVIDYATGAITVTLCAPIIPLTTTITLCDLTGLVVDMILTIGEETVTIIWIGSPGRRLQSGGGNIGVRPWFNNFWAQGQTGTARHRKTPCNGGVNPVCVPVGSPSMTLDIGDQFSCATVGKPETAMLSICTQFKTICTHPGDAQWLNNRPRCQGYVPQNKGWGDITR